MNDRRPQPGAVTQFAVLDALLAGTYESGMPVADVTEHGDFGIGCGEHLGGEVVILERHAFRFTVDAVPERMTDDEVMPFVQVCAFPPGVGDSVGHRDLEQIAADVDQRLLSRNLFHAVRVDGLFAAVRTRVTPPRQHEHESLLDVAGRQVETELTGIRGSLVGFWTPAIYQGLAVAGLHLHFIADDRSVGGHVLEAAVESGQLRVAAFARLDLHLPTDPLFLGTELSHDDDHRIVAIESHASRGR